MGSPKKLECIKGHPLAIPNLVFNSEGFRACKICTYERNNIRRKLKRAELRSKN